MGHIQELRYSLSQVVCGIPGGVHGPCHCFLPQDPHTQSLLVAWAICHHPQILQGLKTSQQFPQTTLACAGFYNASLTQPICQDSLSPCYPGVLFAGCYSKVEIHLSKTGYCNAPPPWFCPIGNRVPVLLPDTYWHLCSTLGSSQSPLLVCMEDRWTVNLLQTSEIRMNAKQRHSLSLRYR